MKPFWFRAALLTNPGAPFRLGAIGAVMLSVAGAFGYAGGWLSPTRLTQDRMMAAFQDVNGTHAGYFVAQDKGYYGNAGLDVTLSRGFGSGDTVKRVAAGTATFGLADTGAIIAAEANEDVPIRIVAMIYDRATPRLCHFRDLSATSFGLGRSASAVLSRSPATCNKT